MEHAQKLRQFITTNFYVAEPATLKDDQSLLESGVVDSTGVLEIVQFLESDFGVKVEDTEIVPENVDTISRLSAFIMRKTKS